MPVILRTAEVSEEVRLTLHVLLQLDEIHRSQSPLCVVGRGHADQLNKQKESSDREGKNQRMNLQTSIRKQGGRC